MKSLFNVNATKRVGNHLEPNQRFFCLMPLDNLAIGDDGEIYQYVDADDAISTLAIFDDNKGMSFNYAEDGNKYEMLSEGDFDKFFIAEDVNVKDVFENDTVIIKSIDIFDRKLYRVYFEDGSSEDVWDNIEFTDYEF